MKSCHSRPTATRRLENSERPWATAAMPRDAMAWVGDEVGNVMASLILPRYQLHDLMHAVMGTPSYPSNRARKHPRKARRRQASARHTADSEGRWWRYCKGVGENSREPKSPGEARRYQFASHHSAFGTRGLKIPAAYYFEFRHLLTSILRTWSL